MKPRYGRLTAYLSALAVAVAGMVVAPVAYAADHVVIDDFESGAGPGAPCPPGVPLGFCTFNGAGSSVALTTTPAPPAPVPGADDPNTVLQMDITSTSFAGFIHGFTSPQDWSTREGISLWMYGRGSGTQLFIDILDNRNPDSTTDDAERWSIAFTDDFTGWEQLTFPFADFTRKEIGNGAPNDGLGLFEMHGYALGALGTAGARTYYVDDVALYGIAVPPAPAINLARQITFIEEGTTGPVEVKLNRPLGADDPDSVSIDYATERSNATPGEDFAPTSGTLTFVKGGPLTQSFTVETFDNTKFTGDKQIVIRLTNPVDVKRGTLFQGSVLIDDDDAFDPKLLDDFEQGAYLWSADDELTLTTPDVSKDGALARPDQDDVESVLKVDTPVVDGRAVYVDIEVLGSLCAKGNGVIPVHLLSTPEFDATAVDHTTVQFGTAAETHTSGRTKTPTRHVSDVNGDGLQDLVFHFRAKDTGYECGSTDVALTGELLDGTPIVTGGVDPVGFGRDFPIAQDWSNDAGLSFWYRGSGSGEEVTVTVKENRAPDPGPAGWELAWADEFNEAADAQPNPANWSYELGDTTPDGKNGWGNEERQYYTDDPKNAATDGAGNLVITLDEADGSQECYYGRCEFESARLISQNKAEFAYGRIESRLKVPTGGGGLWPAFWSLGTDITYNPWPGAGEIDIMEYVSREPNEIFGTIHGPGYAGGESFGGIYDFGAPVKETGEDGYHTFSVEWQPELIVWYVDGIEYHRATPDDVAPNEWVFEKPFFLLLNFAIGGNFGGAIDAKNTYPQKYLVDYVRVYQGPDTAERWETSFTDTVAGWQRVTVPFGDDWVRSSDQPAGAPDDGLSLDEVWGYGFRLPGGTSTGEVMLDEVRLVDTTPPTVTITDNVEADVANDDVTFTFAFSEDVGTSFTADDIVLTGGAKGAFTRVDASTYTLVAKPPADSTGTLEVTVDAGTFTDLAGNANTAVATALQSYDTPPLPSGGLVITFDEPGLNLLGFGGAEDSQVVVDPTAPDNQVLQVVKNPGEVWAGTIVGTEPDARVPVIPFTADNTTISARVWSPDAGIPVRLKVETSDPAVSVETEATTTVTGEWETLSFDFGTPVAGSLDLSVDYNRVVIFFDFGTQGTGKTYYADDITFPGSGSEPPPPPTGDVVITFDEDPAPVLTGFGGADDSQVVVDPTDASNQVAQVLKAAGSEIWAGTTVSTLPNFAVPVIPLTADDTTMSVRVWSPDAGIPVRLKVENSGDGTVSVETEASTTVAGEWEILTFDFANEVPGTAALNPAATYDKVSIFFDFGTTGSGKTYYFEDITWP